MKLKLNIFDKIMASKVPNRSPKVSEMVLIAIAMLSDRNGSSMQAIKKYIISSFNVETKRLQLSIKKYLILAVQSGTLVRTKGKGAIGSFRLGGSMKGKMSELLAKIPVENKSEPPNTMRKCASKKYKKITNKIQSESPNNGRNASSVKNH